MDLETANAPRRLAREGYEAWYLTCHIPGEGIGFWIRYTTFSPGPRSEAESHAALWAFSFDRGDPGRNTAAKETYPLTAAEFKRPFSLRIGTAELHGGWCRGAAGDARWELAWEVQAVAFPYLAAPWDRLAAQGNAASQPRLLISGTIAIGGREHILNRAPGGQQHTWGATHALEWNWAHAAGDWGWLAGAGGRVRSRLGRVLRGTSLGASVGGREFARNSVPGVLRGAGLLSPEGWRADLGRLRLEVRPRPADLIGVTYDDPAGGCRVCYHTEVADLLLSLDGQEVKEEAAAAFEYASPDPLPGLPPRI
ncbi:MAG: hypothetical protein E6I63_05270 [Chloroflexi bacterium]|nr:MAG: hypothetical protein E6I63_05270 [Chloroflexota bacterium]